MRGLVWNILKWREPFLFSETAMKEMQWKTGREKAATFVHLEKWISFFFCWSVSPRFYFRNVTSWTLWNVTDLTFLFWLTSTEDALEGSWVPIYELNRDRLKVTCVYVSLCPSPWGPRFNFPFYFFFYLMCALASGVDRFTWQGHICPSNEALWVIRKQWAMKNWSSLFFVPLNTRQHKNHVLNAFNFRYWNDLYKLIHMSDKRKIKAEGGGGGG